MKATSIYRMCPLREIGIATANYVRTPRHSLRYIRHKAKLCLDGRRIIEDPATVQGINERLEVEPVLGRKSIAESSSKTRQWDALWDPVKSVSRSEEAGGVFRHEGNPWPLPRSGNPRERATVAVRLLRLPSAVVA